MMLSKLFLSNLFIQKFTRPIKAFMPIGVFMDQFLLRQLSRAKLELQELFGILSLEEIVTNKRLTNRYQELHLTMIKTL